MVIGKQIMEDDVKLSKEFRLVAHGAIHLFIAGIFAIGVIEFYQMQEYVMEIISIGFMIINLGLSMGILMNLNEMVDDNIKRIK